MSGQNLFESGKLETGKCPPQKKKKKKNAVSSNDMTLSKRVSCIAQEWCGLLMKMLLEY